MYRIVKSYLTEPAVRLQPYLSHERVWPTVQGLIRRVMGPPTGPGSFAVHYGKDALREAYHDTLERALGSVSSFADRVDGRTVVTADHGELLGEDGRYQHPVDVDDPRLRTVPWFEVETVTRVPDTNCEMGTGPDRTVTDRLQQLGYRN